MSISVERSFYEAVGGGRVKAARSLLRDHPRLDVNWANELRYTALHSASVNNRAESVKLLLEQPAIDVNVKNKYGQTAVIIGCWNGWEDVVQMLLKDPRVDVALGDSGGRTPLWWAACHGKGQVVEWLIASGRDLGEVNPPNSVSTPLEIARERGKAEVVLLLERFMANPTQIRHELRVKLGRLDEMAAEVFALTVFLCDDLLQLKPASHLSSTRFFFIITKLPVELQMVLCHRAVGSMKQNILHKDSEVAFKSLARTIDS